MEITAKEQLEIIGAYVAHNFVLKKRVEALEEITKAQHARLAECARELAEIEKLKAKKKR